MATKCCTACSPTQRKPFPVAGRLPFSTGSGVRIALTQFHPQPDSFCALSVLSAFHLLAEGPHICFPKPFCFVARRYRNVLTRSWCHTGAIKTSLSYVVTTGITLQHVLARNTRHRHLSLDLVHDYALKAIQESNLQLLGRPDCRLHRRDVHERTKPQDNLRRKLMNVQRSIFASVGIALPLRMHHSQSR
jgi:hypothetical protein